jgi:hypothetical protein
MASPSNPDRRHDINDSPETAPRLRLAEQEPSTSDPMRPRTSSSSPASSEPLHHQTSAAGHVRTLPDPRPRCALLLVLAVNP